MGELLEVNTIKEDRSYLFKSCLEEGIISFIQELRLGQQEFGLVAAVLYNHYPTRYFFECVP